MHARGGCPAEAREWRGSDFGLLHCHGGRTPWQECAELSAEGMSLKRFHLHNTGFRGGKLRGCNAKSPDGRPRPSASRSSWRGRREKALHSLQGSGVHRLRLVQQRRRHEVPERGCAPTCWPPLDGTIGRQQVCTAHGVVGSAVEAWILLGGHKGKGFPLRGGHGQGREPMSAGVSEARSGVPGQLPRRGVPRGPPSLGARTSLTRTGGSPHTMFWCLAAPPGSSPTPPRPTQGERET